MKLYRIYIDEVGNHDLTHTQDPNHRFLSLTGVILETNYAREILIPEMNAITREYFQTDPDIPVIFHRADIVNHRPPFSCLNNPLVEQRFNLDVLGLLYKWEYTVITIVIDKREHINKYNVWHYHPYHYCLSVLLERFILFLRNAMARGDVMVEARGGKEDCKLKDSFQRLWEHGTNKISAEKWQEKLTSKELKIKPKSADIAGLQLADIIAHPSRREILLDNRLITDTRNTFGDLIVEILRKSKYYRNKKDGNIYGYGKKLLP